MIYTAGAICDGAGVEDWYPVVKLIHLAAVATSGTLFFLRGMAINLFRASWPMAAPVRYLTYTVDTVLLAAGITLAIIIRQYPFVEGWLTTKVLLLVVYIVLGSFALKRRRTPNVRLVAWIAALAVFVFIISIARAHNPLGIFAS
jgi:uncharacterized membrane protein SirB2